MALEAPLDAGYILYHHPHARLGRVGGRVAGARQRNIQLAVAKAGAGKEQPNPSEALSLALVHSHHECELDGELQANQGEGEARVGGLQGDAGHCNLCADEVARDDHPLEHVRVDARDDKPSPVAHSVTRGEVAQQHQHGPNLEYDSVWWHAREVERVQKLGGVVSKLQFRSPSLSISSNCISRSLPR